MSHGYADDQLHFCNCNIKKLHHNSPIKNHANTSSVHCTFLNVLSLHNWCESLIDRLGMIFLMKMLILATLTFIVCCLKMLMLATCKSG